MIRYIYECFSFVVNFLLFPSPPRYRQLVCSTTTYISMNARVVLCESRTRKKKAMEAGHKNSKLANSIKLEFYIDDVFFVGIFFALAALAQPE